jgi:hypothetical protein
MLCKNAFSSAFVTVCVVLTTAWLSRLRLLILMVSDSGYQKKNTLGKKNKYYQQNALEAATTWKICRRWYAVFLRAPAVATCCFCPIVL